MTDLNVYRIKFIPKDANQPETYLIVAPTAKEAMRAALEEVELDYFSTETEDIGEVHVLIPAHPPMTQP